MRRFAVLLILAVLAALALTSCGGSSSTGIPASIVLGPSPISLNYGQVMQISTVVTDSSGNTLSGQTITFAATDPSGATAAPSASVATTSIASTNGLVCAGAWDSTSSPVVCNPGSTPGPTLITATVGSATATISIYVHPPVTSIAVNNPVTLAGCATAATNPAATVQLSASAFSGNTDITPYVGPFSWTLTPASLGTLDSAVNTTTNTCVYTQTLGNASCSAGSPCNTCKITAASPGQAVVTARIDNVASLPAPYTVCPIKSIVLQDANNATSSTVSNGTAVVLTATATDSSGKQFSTLPGAVTYSTSQPESAAAGATITAAAAGTGSVLAGCIPPNCNAGLYPVYSNPYVMDVSGTTSTTVYVSSTNGGQGSGGTYLVPIDISTGTAGQNIPISTANLSASFAPNSMLISSTGANIVLGTDANGVIIYSIANSSQTVASFNGQVLAASPDGNTMVVYDPNAVYNGATRATPTVYIYSLASSSILASFPMLNTNTARAAFSPDSGTAYIIGSDGLNPSNNALYMWTSSTAPRRLYPAANTELFSDIGFFAQGSFVYLAGGANVSAFANCSNTDVTNTLGFTLPALPAFLRSLPNGAGVLAVIPPNIYQVNISNSSENVSLGIPFGATPANPAFIFPSSTGPAACIPPSVQYTLAAPATFPGINSFTANQLLITSDSSTAFVLSGGQSSVFEYHVASNTGSTIPLANSATLLTQPSGDITFSPAFGDVTPDSASLYVGGSDGNVHLISAGTDTVISLQSSGVPTAFMPDLIAVMP